MTDKEKLIKTLQNGHNECVPTACHECPYAPLDNCCVEHEAAYLLANGVTIRNRRSWVQYAFIAGYVILAVLNAIIAGLEPDLFGRVVHVLTAIAYILAAVLIACE